MTDDVEKMRSEMRIETTKFAISVVVAATALFGAGCALGYHREWRDAQSRYRPSINFRRGRSSPCQGCRQRPCRNEDPLPSRLIAPDAQYLKRLRISMKGAIRFAHRRQAKKLLPAPVTLTLEQAMQILHRQAYRCALTGLEFWSRTPGRSSAPRSPTLDRIKHGGPYSAGNVRVILFGVNSLRGNGADEGMYEVARALLANAKRITG